MVYLVHSYMMVSYKFYYVNIHPKVHIHCEPSTAPITFFQLNTKKVRLMPQTYSAGLIRLSRHIEMVNVNLTNKAWPMHRAKSLVYYEQYSTKVQRKPN